MNEFVPARGDIVWLDFTPQAGREQAGRRPALVLSPSDYNRRTSLCLCCPVTTRVKGYPFEVPLSEANLTRGVVLSDHVRSLDWQARHAEKAETVSQEVLEAVLERLRLLLEP